MSLQVSLPRTQFSYPYQKDLPPLKSEASSYGYDKDSGGYSCGSNAFQGHARPHPILSFYKSNNNSRSR